MASSLLISTDLRYLPCSLQLPTARPHYPGMPIYEYAAEGNGCAHCEAHFDVLQKLRDETLTQCPQCGASVVRIISAPSLASGQSHLLKESHVAKHGFTQYRRAGKGVYEKTTGKGPQFISGD